jgi:hypothetical protein
MEDELQQLGQPARGGELAGDVQDRARRTTATAPLSLIVVEANAGSSVVLCASMQSCATD